jgi:hypothetical protein
VGDIAVHRQRLLQRTPLLFYARYLSLWADCFGKENILVVPFERQQMDGGSIPEILKRLGREDSLVLATDQIEANESLLPEAIDFSHWVACNGEKQIPRGRLRQYLVRYGKSRPAAERKRRYRMSPKERRKLLEDVGPSNEKVAREYLGREDGKLFYEPWPEADEPWEPYPKTSPKDLLRVASWILAEVLRDGGQPLHFASDDARKAAEAA